MRKEIYAVGNPEPMVVHGPDMPDEPEIRYLGDLHRLQIKPGDKFVLMVPNALSNEAYECIRDAWQKFAGGDRDDLIILEGEMKLGVIGL